MSDEDDDKRAWLDRLSDEEVDALPSAVVFFLRDLGGWLALESDRTAQEYSEEIRRLVERHHEQLAIDRDVQRDRAKGR